MAIENKTLSRRIAQKTKKLSGCAKSKTMAFAILFQDVVGILLVSSDFLQTQISASIFGWYLIALGMASKVLRWYTTMPLEDKK